MPRSRFRTYQNIKTYFATSTIIQWLPLFSFPDIAKIVLDSMKFLHTENRMTLHAYVLMENHFHIIASASQFSREMRSLKSYTAKRIILYLKENGPDMFLDQFEFLKGVLRRIKPTRYGRKVFTP